MPKTEVQTKRVLVLVGGMMCSVWTKRVGNNPRVRMLLLHGGPAATHEYFEAFDSYFPAAGIEYYYYDQLGSAYSDQPNEPELWDVAHVEMMAGKVKKGRYLFCPNGSHLAMYDDQKVYVDGVIRFVQDVDAGRF
jgi:hypothetical protein